MTRLGTMLTIADIHLGGFGIDGPHGTIATISPRQEKFNRLDVAMPAKRTYSCRLRSSSFCSDRLFLGMR